MEKRYQEKSVTPVLAAMLLIALTIVAVGIISIFLGLLGPSKEPKFLTISIQSWDSTSITFYHVTGDTVDVSKLKLEGDHPKDSLGSGDWSAGHELVVTGLTGVSSGDRIVLVYEPTGQILLERTLE